MKTENQIIVLEKMIKEKFPDSKLRLDIPENEDFGIWYLDIVTGSNHFTVAYKVGNPLGLLDHNNHKDHSYGEGCPEIFESEDLLIERLLG